MPRQHLHACWCAREEELLPVVVHVNEDIICFLFFLCADCCFVCGCPLYRSLSHRNGGGRGKKIQKEKLALTSLSTKIYLKRAGREHTHTHTRKEEEEEFKKLKKKLKTKKTKRRRKNGERKIRGR